ncbi:unnamed protein product [Closterium sp. NIES-54]
MMEKFFSFMSFYEQHQQGAPAQSNNSNNNNNVTPMSLDGSSYARGNQQQQPTFAPYEPQRGSVSFIPQPASGQERTLDALQVQSQFAHVLKLQTTKPFDGKDFFTWSFEFELMMEGAQILGFFDGSLPYPTNGTQYEKQQYTYQSMMAYTILLRNITPTQQQNIRSYRGYGNSAELAYNHLKNLYQATDSVNQSRLMAQLTTIEMKPGEKGMAYISRCRELRDKLLRCGGSISEDAFVTVVIGGLGPHWRSTRAILRAHGKISEAALCAEIHAEHVKEFKLYHGKGGLYIGKAVLKNNVFVLDFVPDLGTADSDGIVTFTSWTHPPDLDPDFSPEGFWYSHTIPEAERTRALATIQHSAAAETTSAAAETTSAAAETTSAAAGTPTTLTPPVASSPTASPHIDDIPPTPAQQLTPTLPYPPLEKVYSDILYNREPGQGAYSYTITFIDAATRYVWHLNLPSKDMAFEAFIAWLPVAERESGEKLKNFQSDGGGEYTSQRFKQFLAEKGIKRLVSLPYAHQQQGVAERLNRTLQNTMRKLLRGMRLPNHQWPEAMDHAVMLHNLLSSSSLPNNASPHLLWTGKQGSTKMLRVFGCMVQYRPPSARAGRFSQRAQWGLHLGIEKNYNAWKIFDIHSKETVAARDVIFYERLTLPTYLANLEENRDPTGGFRGDRHFCQRSTGDPRLILGKGYRHVGLGGYGRTDPLLNKPFYPNEHGRDFTETFAPVSRHTSLRIILAIAAMKKKKLRQIDVANAFLYAHVDAKIFVELPHSSHGEPNQVCQLLKSLYGIKQAPRLWQQHLHARLIRIGFKQLPHDQGMYRLSKNEDYILLIVYVDDLLYIGSTDSVATWFEGELERDLSLTVSSTVTQYLGLNIEEGENAIYLNAAKYAD